MDLHNDHHTKDSSFEKNAQNSILKKNKELLNKLVQSAIDKNIKTCEAEKIPFQVYRHLSSNFSELSKLDLTAYKPQKNCYTKYLVYNYNKGDIPSFSLTLLLFLPQQKTPIHSHKVDCAPICLKGRIKETLFKADCTSESTCVKTLEKICTRTYKPSQGGYLHQCEPNIHTIENEGHELAASLHLYLFDAKPDEFGNIGSSILNVYS